MAETEVNIVSRTVRMVEEKKDSKFPMVVYHPVEEPKRLFNEEELARHLRMGWSQNRGAFSEIEGMEAAIAAAEEDLREMRDQLAKMKARRKKEEAYEKAYTPPVERAEDVDDDAPGASLVADAETAGADAATAPNAASQLTSPATKGKYVCSICDMELANAGLLSSHMKRHVTQAAAE